LMDRLSGSDSFTGNCGYGHGYSVRDVVAAVKRVSGVDFTVVPAPRRAGDPAQLIADSAAIRQRLGWQPRLDDLDTIVAHALAWEDALARRNSRPSG